MVEPTPFSEPPWLNGHPSPYYSDSHEEWQRFCRKFMQENYAPYAMQWENEGAVPEHVYGIYSSLPISTVPGILINL